MNQEKHPCLENRNKKIQCKALSPSILVSACLFSIPCRYNAKQAKNVFSPQEIIKIQQHYQIVPICPEQLSGLATPREPMEITGGNAFDVLNKKAGVYTKSGEDCSHKMIHGAKISLQLARLSKCNIMVGQNKSPSCSCQRIYDGHFSGKLIQGFGITAALLQNNGIQMMDKKDFLVFMDTKKSDVLQQI